MKEMLSVVYEDVLEIIRKLVREFDSINEIPHKNEKYLHHYFSHQLQERIPISFVDSTGLHPEWATSRNGTSHTEKYRDDGKSYVIDNEKGTSGFIDLAIGNEDNPTLAIEFKMSKQFKSKGISYDYLKLLDKNNSFEKGISIIVLYGRKHVSKTLYLKHLPMCVTRTVEHLSEQGIAVRENFDFWVLEHIHGKTVIHRCNTIDGKFKEIKKRIELDA